MLLAPEGGGPLRSSQRGVDKNFVYKEKKYFSKTEGEEKGKRGDLVQKGETKYTARRGKEGPISALEKNCVVLGGKKLFAA